MTRPLWVAVLTSVLVFAYFLLTTAILIWAERRVVARMQSRVGPNRVGPVGALQTLVDGLKMFFKEDVTPAMVRQPIFTIAPLVGVVAGLLATAVIPIGGEVTIGGETFPLQVADLGVGVLWFLFARNPAADLTTATDTTRTTVDSGAAAGTLAPPEGGTRSGVSRDSQP